MIKGLKKVIPESCWIAEDADLFGDIQLGEDCSVYYHAVLRTEIDRIVIGERTNIQDNCVLHDDEGAYVRIGSDVTIGHSCIIHGCSIGDNSLIGMGSIIMNRAVIGKNVILGAGSLVTGGTEIPDGSLAFGSPAKVIRPLTEEEIAGNTLSAQRYVQHKEEHRR
ncbi:MAG: gamma carbonic anhydrase family protein [Erysipelotrichaceae bacterium]|nr:gamma carbonic anhydrase family protein [Erysipelotrichaceae bacterium]